MGEAVLRACTFVKRRTAMRFRGTGHVQAGPNTCPRRYFPIA